MARIGQERGGAMAQREQDLKLLVIDPDKPFRTSLAALSIAGAHISALDPGDVGGARRQLSTCDVIVVGIDTPAGLALVADLCKRPETPPVIAVGGIGIAGTSAEHVLLQAEVRGAALSLPKPIEPGDLVLAASGLLHAMRNRPEPRARIARTSARPKA